MAKLEFNEETHQYLLDGKPLISVTQLMQKHGLAPKYDGVDLEILKKKAERGSLVHKEIEDFIKEGEIGFTKEVANFKHYVEKHQIQVECSEQKLYNDIVAGTCDLVLFDNGKPIIADIKTTYELHYKSVSWQLSIYLYLFLNSNEMWEKVIGKYDEWKGQAFHFNKEGKLAVVRIPLQPYEEVEKLMECERNGVIYGTVQAIAKNDIVQPRIANNDVAQIVTLENVIRDLDAKVKGAKAKQDELKQALIKEMEERGLKTYENEGVRITYIAPSKRTTIDAKRLQIKHPDLYEEFKKETEIKATIRITLGGKDE